MICSTRVRSLGLSAIVVLVALLGTASCSPVGNLSASTPERPGVSATEDLWSRLLQRAPYPYTTPLPPERRTAVDGTYSKFDPREGTRPFCRRCMPYPAEGGLWLLQLEKGAYRILSTRSLNGWRSLGSYTVTDDRLALFNDPHCIEAVGTYKWGLQSDQLVLELIEDECAEGWRGITFTNYPWVVDDPQGGD